MLLSKVRALGRDQRQFGRRKQGAKRTTTPTSSTSHPKGFAEFVDYEPVRLSALEKLRATAKLSETAAAATKQAEAEASEASEKAKQPVPVFLSNSEAVSEPSSTPLSRVAIFTGDSRTRPIRRNKASSSSSKQTDRALYSLMRGSV